MMQQMKDEHEKQRRENKLANQQIRQHKVQQQDVTKLSNDVDELERALFGGNII
jgi:hypothetical protein